MTACQPNSVAGPRPTHEPNGFLDPAPRPVTREAKEAPGLLGRGSFSFFFFFPASVDASLDRNKFGRPRIRDVGLITVGPHKTVANRDDSHCPSNGFSDYVGRYMFCSAGSSRVAFSLLQTTSEVSVALIGVPYASFS